MCKEKSESEVKSLTCVGLFATPWTVAYQAPTSMGFSKQEYWSRLPFPSPGDLPDPGIEPRSPALQADSLPTELRGTCFGAPSWGERGAWMGPAYSVGGQSSGLLRRAGKHCGLAVGLG